MSFLILILGILFLIGCTKIVNMYYNFYHIYKDLDNNERIKYFYNNIIVNLISRHNKIKKIFIFYILIPLIKINYIFLSFEISLMHSLCELDFDKYMNENGFSIHECSHQEVDKILNFNDFNDHIENEINDDDNKTNNLLENKESQDNNNLLKNESIENTENTIDQNLSILLNNQNSINQNQNENTINSELLNFNNFSIENENINNEKLENIVKNNNINFSDNNKIINIEEIIKDVEPTDLNNLIKYEENNEVLKMDDIDFGENLNNFINNYTEENKKEIEINKEVLIIKTGKKKNKV